MHIQSHSLRADLRCRRLNDSMFRASGRTKNPKFPDNAEEECGLATVAIPVAGVVALEECAGAVVVAGDGPVIGDGTEHAAPAVLGIGDGVQANGFSRGMDGAAGQRSCCPGLEIESCEPEVDGVERIQASLDQAA